MEKKLPKYRKFSIKNFTVRDPDNIDRELTKYNVDCADVINIMYITDGYDYPYYRVFYIKKANKRP